MAFFLAVDAGGTKTDFVLADETRILARHRTGTIKRLRTDAESAYINFESAIAALQQASGVSVQNISRTCVGTAGETVPLVADWLRKAFGRHVGGRLLLLGDVEIALDAAFRGGPGVLVLAGTGSNVAGRTPSGRMTTCGGWGPILSDQGSGHAIGLRALRSIFLAIDQERSTAMLDEVLAFWSLPSIASLIEYANQTPPPDVSRLAQLVVSCAEQGDQVAQEVLLREGQELAYLVQLLIARLRRLDGDTSFVPSIAFAGSIMERVAPVRDALLASLHDSYPALRSLPGVVDPIDGALWRARDVQAFETRFEAVTLEQDAHSQPA